MTVETEDSGLPVTKSGPYNGNGSTSVFDYDFQIQDQEELILTRQNADGSETTLVLTTDYTVSGVGDDSGGQITLVDPANDLPTGTKLVIQYTGDYNQGRDWSSQGGIDLAQLENALDKITMHLRQLKEVSDRAVTVDAFGSIDIDTLRTNINILGGISSDVSTVAGISANVTTVAGISANVTTVAGISSDVTTVAGITANIAAVVADEADIGTVATNIANVNTVAGISANVTTVAGISANVTAVANDATDIGTVAGSISNVNTVAGIDSDVTTVAGIAANVTAVAGDATDIGTVATNIANVNTVAGISANVTTVAGISANVTTVAGANTNIGTVATDIANVNTVATNIANVNAVGGISANVTTVAGISADVTTVAGNSANVTTVAGISGNVTTVAGISADVTTVAGVASDVTGFHTTYLGAKASDPTLDNSGNALIDGAEYFNTTANEKRVYDLGNTTWLSTSYNSSNVAITGGTITGVSSLIVGGSSGVSPLHVYGDNNTITMQANTASQPNYLLWRDSAGANRGLMGHLSNTDMYLWNYVNGPLLFGVNNSEGMRLTPTGLGIGTSSPFADLHVQGAAPEFRMYSSNTTGGLINFIDQGWQSQIQGSGGHLMFMTGGTTERMRIGSGGGVGIGASPVSGYDLTVSNSAGSKLLLTSSAGGTELYFDNSGANLQWIKSDRTAGDLRFGVANTEAVRIDSNGNVGVNSSVPSTRLSAFSGSSEGIAIDAAGFAALTLTDTTDTSVHAHIAYGADTLYISQTDTAGTIRFFNAGSERLRIGSGGDIEMKSTAQFLGVANTPTNPTYSFTADTDTGITRPTADTLTFVTGGSERARIDSSGNLLVGTTSTGLASASSGSGTLITSNTLTVARSGGTALFVNRTTGDGTIQEWRKAGATVGSIFNRDADDIAVNTAGGTGSLAVAGTDRFIWNVAIFAGATDNTYDLGSTVVRWDDVYATNGAIQTSDRNEKQDIETLSEAEARVAQACKGLLRKFRWIDSVKEKGDNARTHFGIIAQDLQDAFTAEGLDAGDYAMFISTTWYEDEEGKTYEEQDEEGTLTERTRLGVRYPELLAFIIAAL